MFIMFNICLKIFLKLGSVSSSKFKAWGKVNKLSGTDDWQGLSHNVKSRLKLQEKVLHWNTGKYSMCSSLCYQALRIHPNVKSQARTCNTKPIVLPAMWSLLTCTVKPTVFICNMKAIILPEMWRQLPYLQCEASCLTCNIKPTVLPKTWSLLSGDLQCDANCLTCCNMKPVILSAMQSQLSDLLQCVMWSQLSYPQYETICLLQCEANILLATCAM